MRKSVTHDEKLSNLVNSLAALLSTTPDVFAVLQRCAKLLDCIVQEDGHVILSSGNGKKRKRSARDTGSGNIRQRQHSPLASESEHVNEHIMEAPLAVCDARRAKQCPRLSGGADGQEVLQYLLHPVPLDVFHASVDNRVIHVARPQNRTLFKGWFGKDDVDSLLRNHGLVYTLNINVTKFDGMQRLNFFGDEGVDGLDDGSHKVASADTVWELFKQGWSVRVLHPQRWCDRLWEVMSRLEDYFGQGIGCNAYLTPPASQGFAPHWDDIDAFIVQLAGQKRWRLYAPCTEAEVLPMHSSEDLSPGELGELMYEVVLQPGDVLYMPRGTVHQAEALSDHHSLHITLSVNQRNSWSDFLQAAIPQAVGLASDEEVDLRRTLPFNWLRYMGVAMSDVEELQQQRIAFERKAESLTKTVLKYLPLDSTADFFAAEFLRGRLPPVLSVADTNLGREKTCKGKRGSKTEREKHAGQCKAFKSMPSRLCRLLLGDDGIEVVHCLHNSRAVHAERGAVRGPVALSQQAVTKTSLQGVSSPGAADEGCDEPSREGCGVDMGTASAVLDDGSCEEGSKPRLLFPHGCGPTLEALLGFSRPAEEASVVALSDVPLQMTRAGPGLVLQLSSAKLEC